MAKQINEVLELRNNLVEKKNHIISVTKELLSLKYDYKYQKIIIKETETTNNISSKLKTIKEDYKANHKKVIEELKNLKADYKESLNEYMKSHKEVLSSLDSQSEEYKEFAKKDYISSLEKIDDELVLKLGKTKKDSANNLKQITRTKETHLVQYLKKEAVLDEKKYALAKVDYKELKFEFNQAYKRINKESSNKTELRKNKVLWNYYYLFKEFIIHRFKSEPLLVARDIVIVFSALSLALSLNYIRAVKQVTNSISALLMFAFILFGLISIFNVTRMREAYSRKFYTTTGMLLVTIGCGLAMSILCLTGTQDGIKFDLVYTGVMTSFIINAGYLIALIFIIVARIAEAKSMKKKQ